MTRSRVSFDFVVYAGEQGETAVRSRELVKDFANYRDQIGLGTGEDAYGAILVEQEGKLLAEPQVDPIRRLVTNIVRTVSYVIDGEPETVLLSESLHGFLFEVSNEDVLVSFFKGADAFDPEEFLLERMPMDVGDFAEQIIALGERLLDLLKAADPDGYKEDEFGASLIEFLDVGKESFRSFRLERERGLRR